MIKFGIELVARIVPLPAAIGVTVVVDTVEPRVAGRLLSPRVVGRLASPRVAGRPSSPSAPDRDGKSDAVEPADDRGRDAVDGLNPMAGPVGLGICSDIGLRQVSK